MKLVLQIILDVCDFEGLFGMPFGVKILISFLIRFLIKFGPIWGLAAGAGTLETLKNLSELNEGTCMG